MVIDSGDVCFYGRIEIVQCMVDHAGKFHAFGEKLEFAVVEIS